MLLSVFVPICLTLIPHNILQQGYVVIIMKEIGPIKWLQIYPDSLNFSLLGMQVINNSAISTYACVESTPLLVMILCCVQNLPWHPFKLSFSYVLTYGSNLKGWWVDISQTTMHLSICMLICLYLIPPILSHPSKLVVNNHYMQSFFVCDCGHCANI